MQTIQRTRILGTGTSALQVSSIGLGCMGMSLGLGPAADHDQMVTLIRHAVDLGVNPVRHRRGLRAVRQRGARRWGACPGA